MNTIHEAHEACEQFAAKHLAELAAEVLEWHSTALLRDGKMRVLGQMCKPLDNDSSLRMAESFVNVAALRAATAQPAAPAVVDTRCPQCLGSEFPGWKRGIRCATCNGSAHIEPTPPEGPQP